MEPPLALAALFGWLGSISYPLYAVHKPAHALAVGVIIRAGWKVPALPFEALFVVAIVLIASGMERTVERPLRRWLDRRPRPMRQPIAA